jgi:hypothetical protein
MKPPHSCDSTHGSARDPEDRQATLRDREPPNGRIPDPGALRTVVTRAARSHRNPRLGVEHHDLVTTASSMIPSLVSFATPTNAEPAHWRDPVTPGRAQCRKRHSAHRARRNKPGCGPGWEGCPTRSVERRPPLVEELSMRAVTRAVRTPEEDTDSIGVANHGHGGSLWRRRYRLQRPALSERRRKVQSRAVRAHTSAGDFVRFDPGALPGPSR